MNVTRPSLSVGVFAFCTACNTCSPCEENEGSAEGASEETASATESSSSDHGEEEEGEESDGQCVNDNHCGPDEANCRDCIDCGDGNKDPSEDCDDGNDQDDDDCVGVCQVAACGDDYINANTEICDDGAANTIVWGLAPRCNRGTTLIKPCEGFAPFCGDGVCEPVHEDGQNNCAVDCPTLPQVSDCGNSVLEPGEKCDGTPGCHGKNAQSASGQDLECLLNICGDGLAAAGEACDDENQDDHDDCVHCQDSICGDGYLQTIGTKPAEQCDPGIQNGEKCSLDCEIIRTAFISSTTQNGNLGGLAGADAKCNALADAAQLSGRYKAWLSANNASPSTRFDKTFAVYTLTDGTVIARGWDDLTDGTLLAAINVDEKKMVSEAGAWTHTETDGTQSMGSPCGNWMSSVGTAGIGNPSDMGLSWTEGTLGQSCGTGFAIYCFEDV